LKRCMVCEKTLAEQIFIKSKTKIFFIGIVV
jgi:hypothetical protein